MSSVEAASDKLFRKLMQYIHLFPVRQICVPARNLAYTIMMVETESYLRHDFIHQTQLQLYNVLLIPRTNDVFNIFSISSHADSDIFYLNCYLNMYTFRVKHHGIQRVQLFLVNAVRVTSHAMTIGGFTRLVTSVFRWTRELCLWFSLHRPNNNWTRGL